MIVVAVVGGGNGVRSQAYRIGVASPLVQMGYRHRQMTKRGGKKKAKTKGKAKAAAAASAVSEEVKPWKPPKVRAGWRVGCGTGAICAHSGVCAVCCAVLCVWCCRGSRKVRTPSSP